RRHRARPVPDALARARSRLGGARSGCDPEHHSAIAVASGIRPRAQRPALQGGAEEDGLAVRAAGCVGTMSARYSLFEELKRRNVLRAAALYAGAVWALAQGISQLGPPLGAPEWITRWFVIAACVGFPFWIAFAWFYEFTPQGLKRESEIAPGDSVAHSTGRKLDKWIIAVLVVAVVLLLTNTFVWRKGAGLAGDSALASAPTKSIAVLPFEDLSPGHDHGYFSAGMAEELLNALARVQDLKVAGRASSFYYGSRNADLRTIGKALNAANVLEGSVRTQGQAVRISVQLIRTRDGFEAWSQSYDGNLGNIFDLQERIDRAITDHLKVVLGD